MVTKAHSLMGAPFLLDFYIMTDLEIARKYIGKAQNAEAEGHVFKLTFAQFKKLMNQSRCAYTGVKLSRLRGDGGQKRSIDRFDATIGYVPGNCYAVCEYINKIKGRWENPTADESEEVVIKLIESLQRLRNERDEVSANSNEG